MIRFLVVAMVGLLAFGSATASATTVSSGETINFDLSGANGVGGSNAAVTGDGSITVLFDADSITFNLVLHQDATSPADTRFTAFGFRLTPEATGGFGGAITDTGGATDTDAFIAVVSEDLPNFADVNVCVRTQQNCNAGDGGLLPGQTDMFSFSLTGTFGTTVDIDLITMRVTGCVGCSFEIPGTVTGSEESVGDDDTTQGNPETGNETSVGTNEVTVPGPAPVALIGLGLAGVAIWGRMRRR